MLYKASIPYLPSMGSVSPIMCRDTPLRSKEEDCLDELNRMRDHDGLPPWPRLPKGVVFSRQEPREYVQTNLPQ